MKTYHKDENGNVLMHSDVYLGEDYISSNLYHWKYIKKEKKDGRWVYYYKDDISSNLQKEADDSYSKLVDAKRQRDNAENTYMQSISDFNSGKYMDDYYKDKDRLNKKYKEKWYDSKATKEYKKNMRYIDPISYNRRAENDVDRKRMEYNDAYRAYSKAYQKVKDVSARQKKNAGLSARLQRSIAKTMVKTLNSVSNAISKGKKRFKKIFG